MSDYEIKLINGSWMKNCEKELPHNLTTEEKVQYGLELSQSLNEVALLESRAKSAKKQIEAEIASEQALADSKSSALRDGFEHRPTECFWTYDWEANKAECFRKDSGELVSSRQIHHEERQVKLKWEDDRKVASA